jgi:1-acyl-sn-glycerol-3-phosphate acyltransferase
LKAIVFLFRPIWKLLFLLNFILGLIVLYPLFRWHLRKKESFPKALRLKRFWAAWIMSVPGIRFECSFEVPLEDYPQPCVFCANHTSYLDIVASYRRTPGYYVFMGKGELRNAPLFGMFFKEMNIPVFRHSRSGSHKAYLRAGEEIDKGHSVFLYPEATIPTTAPRMKVFKNGAFKLAIDKQVPVVPVTFIGNWKILQNGGFFKSNGRPGLSKVVYHKPIDTKGMTETDLISLRERVFNTIDKTLREEKQYE